ncbi:MAG: GYD domain-containing protein [bacterium]
MAYYMAQISYTQDSIKAMAATPQDRGAEAAKLLEAMGGKVHQFFFAFGDYDAVIIGELPDNVTMAACSMAVSAAGTVSAFKTTPLLTMDEAMEAMKKAGAVSGYRPPAS